jgi:hypothetical protein
LVLIGLFIFVFYLSIFFASAFYKVFFEKDLITNYARQGLLDGINPKLVEANAIFLLFKNNGLLFGIIGMIFFIIPVIISNLKIIGSNDIKLNRIMFWIGILIFDIIVATMVAINVNRIECLKQPNTPRMEIYEVFCIGEFWLMFVFGMLPLLIMHHIIEHLISAYRNSKKELIDAEKNKELQILEKEMIDLNFEKENITKLIDLKKENIETLRENLKKLDLDFNNHKRQIDEIYDAYFSNARLIYDDFKSKIISGKIFTESVMNNVITSYKLGFIEYLPEYYATDEVAARVKEIEQILNN